MIKKQKETIHQKVTHHLKKHFHKHVHKVLHVTNFMHHHLFHCLELIVIITITLTSFGFTNLTGLNQDLYRNSDAEVAEHLLSAMENPGISLKAGNIISIWSMDTTIENTFAKWYCTYGAARISPEFFPYVDTQTQQRTWWGNAVDRCKNASDTGYKIWTTPAQWALVVYNAGGKFGSYGHVGKVLHYDKSLKKIIVRDMARVSRWSMSDRWEDLTTASVKCYIYNSKTTTPDTTETPEVNIGIVANTWTNTNNGNQTPSSQTQVQTPTTPIVTPAIPVETPIETPVVTKPVVVTPTVPTVTSQETINKNISLKFDNLSDIAEHFMTQNDVSITLISKSPLKIGEAATLTVEIKDKKTGEKYSGLLPFAFTILSTNDALQASISNLKIINNWSVDISIIGQKIWTTSIVVSMDGTKIGEFSLEVK